MTSLSIGESLYEVTCFVKEEIKEGSTNRFEEKNECAAGHAGNIAYLLGKWGVDSYIASMIGSDDEANSIKKDYETVGVKIDFCETCFDKATSKRIIINKNFLNGRKYNQKENFIYTYSFDNKYKYLYLFFRNSYKYIT